MGANIKLMIGGCYDFFVPLAKRILRSSTSHRVCMYVHTYLRMYLHKLYVLITKLINVLVASDNTGNYIQKIKLPKVASS